MPIKYQFGGLGRLFTCSCGCTEFVRAERVQPEYIEVYECANCHEWYAPKNNVEKVTPTRIHDCETCDCETCTAARAVQAETPLTIP